MQHAAAYMQAYRERKNTVFQISFASIETPKFTTSHFIKADRVQKSNLGDFFFFFWAGGLEATPASALDWQPHAPPIPVDGQQWAGPTPPKARGRFRAVLRNGPLRWMRDWGPAANRPPFWGRSARRGGAAGIGNVASAYIQRLHERCQCEAGFAFILPLSLHLS